jgi:hypothetical protein
MKKPPTLYSSGILFSAWTQHSAAIVRTKTYPFIPADVLKDIERFEFRFIDAMIAFNKACYALASGSALEANLATPAA